jgi:putative heme-binding domain-containing protein
MMQLVVAAAVGLGDAGHPEAWADPRLPVREGLGLWLDAGRQGEAYAAAGRAGLLDGVQLGVWYDASGRGRDFVQRERAAQPKLVRVGAGGTGGGESAGGAVVRFDGVDDVLSFCAGEAPLAGFTLFVCAAPRSNAGGFRALFAANAVGRNDYQSGFNVDLSWPPTSSFETLNVEGSGFGGAADLLEESFEFGTLHVLAVVSTPPGPGTASDPRGSHGEVRFFADELSVGARFYSNTSDVPCSSGFLEGDVAEVLLYERALSDEECEGVERWLERKHAALARALVSQANLRRVPLEPVKPAAVQLLVPGFSWRELPVELQNVNNLRYREDGTLVAGGYDGNVWLLDDRDGDGIEESVRRYFENRGSIRAPIGMALAPPGFPPGRGVIVACKERIVLLADEDGDDLADAEKTIASGWPPGSIPHDVDALGIAIAPDGRLYFGLGAADYTNAYLVDASGRGRYELRSERGTIQEVSADQRSRRTYCTGIRFSVGLAFNRRGDLFATDQEGATWLPNGNPFDELLHVQEGRHYGFPPRHPRHLPGVIDEPALFEYAPQHQSTCGLCFDEPAAGRPCFGPTRFEGDAFVAGYSRGKLDRTQLSRSRAGYVARTQLFARFDALACDVALSPRGDLAVAVHGGSPDWGSGPTGRGRLHQLRWRAAAPPLPVAAWAAGTQEVRVAFDRELDPTQLAGFAASSRIVFGEAVSPADRFEVHRPGYAVVERQIAAPRFELPVLAVKLVEDRRTLRFDVAPHALRLPHALEAPGLDLAYDLGGVEARFAAPGGGEELATVLPHLDLSVARAFTAGSREHEKLWGAIERPGTLTLRGALDLWRVLRPAVQPGSRVDYEWPPEEVTVELRSNRPIGLQMAGARVEAQPASGGAHVVRATVSPSALEPVGFEATLAAGGGEPALDVAFWTDEDSRPRALPLHRFVLPWAARLGAETAEAASDPLAPRPELAGGNWSRGRAVFFGDDAMCSRCHTLRDGTADCARARIGPDLSKLWQRDLASVRKDVLEPSAALNPDHLACEIELRSGERLAGVARDEPDGTIVVGEAGGKETRIRASDVVRRKPLSISIMPAGLHNVLSERQIADLFAYALAPPLEPAPISIDGAPPPRSLAFVETLLASAMAGGRTPSSSPSIGSGARSATKQAAGSSNTGLESAAPALLRIVLVGGPKDHGPDEHDYPDWQRRWARLLSLADGVAVETATGWPSQEHLASADALVFYCANPEWRAERGPELDAFLARGGGLVMIHFAVNGGDAAAELAQRIGLAWRPGASRFRHGRVDLELAPAARDHPITRGLGAMALSFVDETYWEPVGDEASVVVLATSTEEGRARPQLFAREAGGGRAVVSILGHYRWTFDDPLYRLLLLRGIAWAAHEPEDRLNELATVGARIDAAPSH